MLLLPVAVMFLLCLCRVPMKRAMLGSIIAACAVALLVQGASPLDLPRVLVLGFHLPEGTLAASLIHGGGISSMASGCLVVLTSCALAGILEGTHATAALRAPAEKWAWAAIFAPRSLAFSPVPSAATRPWPSC